MISKICTAARSDGMTIFILFIFLLEESTTSWLLQNDFFDTHRVPDARPSSLGPRPAVRSLSQSKPKGLKYCIGAGKRSMRWQSGASIALRVTQGNALAIPSATMCADAF